MKKHLEKYMENEDIAVIQKSGDQSVSKRGSNCQFYVNETNEDFGFQAPERHDGKHVFETQISFQTSKLPPHSYRSFLEDVNMI